MARPKQGVTFWDRVHSQLKLTDSGCHEFMGHKDECGYGRIHKDGGLVRIHRAKWEFYYGEIPDGMCVCHKCDNPACVKIEHLFLGTHAENMRDRLIKGRCASLKGSTNGSSKLTEQQVMEIKKLLSLGFNCAEISRKYNVTDSNIHHIKSGRKWKHISC